MQEVKWIKINTDIFDDEKFKLIDALPEADAIQLIWFKLLVFAGRSNSNGIFMFNDKVAYTDEMLAHIFNRPINIVRLALETFERFEMIEQIDGVYVITNWDKHQSVSDYHEKKKKYDRERKAKLKTLEKQGIEEKSYDQSYDFVRNYSYSISKSNISNLNSLLEEDRYIDIKNNIELVDVMKSWMEYKDTKGKQHLHYAEQSINALIKKFAEMEQLYGISGVRKAVEETIGHGWQGIVWEKAEKANKSQGYDWERL